MALHHRIQYLLPLLLQVLPLLVPLLHPLLLVHRSQQHLPLLILLHLSHSRVRVFVRPLYCQHLVPVQSLISHRLLCKLSHAPVSILYESIPLMRQNIDVFDFTPNCKVPQQDLVHLSHSALSARQTILTDVKSLRFFGKTSDALHIFSKGAESSPSENVFGLIDALAVFNAWNFMVVFAVDSIGAAPSGEEETVVGCSFLIEEISCCIAYIQFGVAPGQGSLFIFFIL